ncbi:tetratricopeptide repeat protein, partial [Candidatus Peregrinibacteria bacterium]|nr:tetratricopeptide repeat protein [Candidatus Peregrinibacteria bacterium]
VGDKLKTVLSQQKDFKAFKILQRTYSNAPLNPSWKKISKSTEEAKGFKGCGDVPITRLFINNPDIKFTGEVHEEVDPSLRKLNFPIANTDIVLHHYEYEKGEEYVKKKQLHYLDLCMEKEKLQPENAKNLNDIGTIYRNYKKDTKKAEEYFKKAIKADTNFTKAYNNLAEIYISQNKLKQAAKILEKALKQKQSAQTYSNLGMIYGKLEDFDKAIESYIKALTIDPQRPRALSNLGVVYLKKGDEENAIRAFKHALNMDKKNVALYVQLAALYDKIKDKENAIKFYTYLIKMKHPQKDIFEKRIAVLSK